MVSKRNAQQRTELSAASAVLLCRLFSAVTYLTIDEMQMIAKKVTYSYVSRLVAALLPICAELTKGHESGNYVPVKFP